MNQSKTTALVIVAAIILLAIGIAFTRYQSAHSPTLVAAATPQPAAQVTTVATSQPVTTTMPKFDVNGFKDRLVSFGMPIKDVSIFTDSPLALSINFTSASTLDVEIASYVVDYAARSEAVNGVFIHELGGLGKIIQDNEYIKSVSKKI